MDVKNNELLDTKLELELGSTEREQDKDSILERTDTPEDKREKEVDTVSDKDLVLGNGCLLYLCSFSL